MNKEKAFCVDCLRTLSHQRYHSSLANWMNVFSLGIFRRKGLGPWFCRQCGRKSFWLPKATDKPIERVAQKSDQCQIESAQEPESNLAGNYILDEQSLVRRVEASNRFSQKYRDNVVERIISNRSFISKVCRELEVTESDVQYWIKQWIKRRFDLLKINPELADRIWESIENDGKYNHPHAPTSKGLTIIEGTVED